MRIAICGAGPSGLSQLHAFECVRQNGDPIPDIVCFEKQSDLGGQWNYSWRTGLNEYSEPVHSSMYPNLWTNLPKECSEFVDYSFDEHFGQSLTSFPPRAVFYDYIQGYAKRNNVRQYIQFNTVVRWISYSDEKQKFHLYKYGVKSVILSYRTRPKGFKWPDLVQEVPLLVRIDKENVLFKDDSFRKFDAIIFCTGYVYHFPFLDNNLRLKSTNTLYPPDLYKSIVWMHQPRLLYLSMLRLTFSFNVGNVQEWFARDLILGKINLPLSKEEMTSDMKHWQMRAKVVQNFSDYVEFQRDYVQNLVEMIDYPRFNLDEMVRMLLEYGKLRSDNLLTFREQIYVSTVSNTLAKQHHTPWLKEMDDSLENFIKK
ncbi:unnamed protein product [Rotaria socialis]|uniref:Flavin-containing monooxygenase n=1 Tax=Rotaria socialis TaxID=392032 RepID=A0A821I5M1_9BILA|nr:unnamed protein product [Rotaria socialis]